MKLAHGGMEQELHRAKRQQQVVYAGASTNKNSSVGRLLAASFNSGVAAFEVEYARWVEDHNRQASKLRAALGQRQPDTAPEPRLRTLVEAGSRIQALNGLAGCSFAVHRLGHSACRSPTLSPNCPLPASGSGFIYILLL